MRRNAKNTLSLTRRGRHHLAVKSSASSEGIEKGSQIFVAGATGRLGSRIVAELLNSGYKVVAGARNPSKMQSILQEMTSEGKVKREVTQNLKTVQFDIETDSVQTLQGRIAGCAAVISAVGAAESNLLDNSGPARIDGDGAIKIVDAAKGAGVKKFTMISALGTGSKMFTFPAGLLNLFWGVLFQKQKAEKALEASGLDYTIIRPGGMERPQDDFKYTHNLECYSRDSLSGGVVSRRQVAEFVAAAIDNDAAKNSIFEVIAQTPEFAPNRTMADALQAVIKVPGIQG